jgi:hypothetical protein
MPSLVSFQPIEDISLRLLLIKVKCLQYSFVNDCVTYLTIYILKLSTAYTIALKSKHKI